ncbi:exported protein of unknown function (plasmid) [Cupriavidus taiwanensis]|uniref:Uncharacterized protein n=1 Tax=Cupriavidus taiwanensis TaxID=164546 RepID=A0A375IW22_9BURK|nr:exported protein of unknown function [Cupriavidus taiwanensis]
MTLLKSVAKSNLMAGLRTVIHGLVNPLVAAGLGSHAATLFLRCAALQGGLRAGEGGRRLQLRPGATHMPGIVLAPMGQ